MIRQRKNDKRQELPDIPEWVNAAYYEKQERMYAEQQYEQPTQEPETCQTEQHDSSWHKKEFWAVLIVSAFAIGTYIGQNTPPFAQPVRPVRYVVQPHETLWDITSKVYGESRDKREASWEIIEDNQLDHNGTIKPGMVLKLRNV